MQQTRGEYSQSEFEKADRAISLFNKLEETLQAKNLICLRYLNNYGSNEPLLQRAIDLRVCLDAIFFNEETVTTAAFKKRVRSLSIQESGKCLSGKKIDAVYDTCSEAVHAGIFKNPDRADADLARGAMIARKALWKIFGGRRIP